MASGECRLKLWVIGSLIAGLALVIGLIAWRGVGTVVELLASGGVSLLLLGLFYVIPIALAALSWGCLFPDKGRPRYLPLVRATWIGLSVNWLLPVAQIGGELVKARLIARDGIPGPVAGASVVADKTLQAFTQLIYTLVGLVLLVAITGGRDFLIPVLGTTAVFALGIYVFFRLQNAGLFGFLVSLGGRMGRIDGFMSLLGSAEALDARLRDVYRRRWQLLQATGLRLAFRLAMAGEVWLALLLLGHPVSVTEAIVLESRGQAIRAAAFAVPAGIGVQEGGFIILGMVLGVGPEVGLVLSLAKRFRELLVGLSGLAVWHFLEGHDLMRRRRNAGATTPSVEEP
jgi:putative membrane protein